ncbi:MAG: hypothetical protein BAJALOKI1v1_280012 [Promethearchaeota archaeon]|nr:MAG: hypothetical protein BAJALOKI1v1_280012 [Candidatus Lokiarchaeota archaeon]
MMAKLQNKKKFEDYVLDTEELLSKINKEKKIEDLAEADLNILHEFLVNCVRNIEKINNHHEKYLVIYKKWLRRGEKDLSTNFRTHGRI